MACFWHEIGKAREIPDAVPAQQKLQCVSYSPFDKDQSPFEQPLALRPERMEADLALLSKRFQCIRTYSTTGLEGIPDLARKHGLKLLLGAWVSADAQQTRQELDTLIRLANANADIVEAVIVGNETLLRKEVTATRLAGLIEEVKQAVSVPVTYADVWEFWLKHPEIAPAVDFLTIHLLPYWEDNPSGIEHALQEVEQVRQVFGGAFAPKGILIGETGWPSAGRQRETAVADRVNQASFIRGFVQMAEANGWRYNLIEAFDQPWKRASEGTVGGYWGLYDADRQDKGSLQGAISNQPHWPLWLGGGLGLWLLALGLGGIPRNLRDIPGHGLIAAVGVTSLSLWTQTLMEDSRNWAEWSWGLSLVALNLIVLLHTVMAHGSRQGRRACVLAWLDAHAAKLLLASGFAAAVMTLGLVFDARYRGFPSAALLLPALAYAYRAVPAYPRESSLLLALLCAGIAPQLYQEGLQNIQALGWAAVSLILAVALWRGLKTGKRTMSQPT
ncbi:beta (1-6) glucans synthase [Pseudomonas sp. ABC1]|uniref:glycoside hydrolase family 17 protein n=1 Tax=Pseudomonas sp. ABC1 TaxID=2748080 RepID=UPI00358F878C